MIRRARHERWLSSKARLPSPQQIRQMTAEIRKGWSPAQLARRAGQARRVQVMIVSALDLEQTRSEEI